MYLSKWLTIFCEIFTLSHFSRIFERVKSVVTVEKLVDMHKNKLLIFYAENLIWEENPNRETKDIILWKIEQNQWMIF